LLEKGAAEISESVTAAMPTALTVNDVLEPLMRYSLVHLNEANATYGVHRLLQAIMQDAMTEPERREWTERAVRAVNVAFPDIQDFAQWTKCDQFLPHALSIIQWIGKFDLQSTEDIVKLLNKIGFFLRTRSRYGTMRPPTEFTSNEWAKWYEQLGWELSKLEDLLGKLREKICSKNQNNENIDTSLCLNNLAYLYESQRSYEKAQKLFKEALDIRKKLKDEPNYIAGSLNNLAEIYFKKGEYEKAEKLYLEALEIRQKAFGKDNDWTAGSFRNLAKLYFYPDFFKLKFKSSPNFYNEKVKPHCKETLEIHEKLYSVSHPFTAQSLSNLAYVYQIQKEYKDAELYFTQALNIFEQTQGPEHRDTAASLLSLAKLYEDQKSYKKAESFYERALSIYKKALGPEDINTAFSLNNLARLYHAQELYSKAEPLCTQALGILEKALGVEHRRTKKCAELLSRIRHGLDAQGVGAHVVEPAT
jgi:tetratricopeptide (TPR) repeat protein